MKETKIERVQKLLSQAGIASRRKAEELILQGKVYINGTVARLGDRASFNDRITINNQPISPQEKVYYMINKPEKTICSLKDPQGRKIITDLIDDKRFLFPIGRLDYNTTGTLLITNDGELANRLIHPSYEITRVYRARLDNSLTTIQLAFLNSDNVFLDGKKSKQNVEAVDNKTYIVSLKVGTYHHVKKLFEISGHRVQSLTRIEFAGLSHVQNLKRGEYRKLNHKEVNWLKRLAKMEK